MQKYSPLIISSLLYCFFSSPLYRYFLLLILKNSNGGLSFITKMFVPKRKVTPLVVNVAAGAHSSRDSAASFPSLTVTGSNKKAASPSPSNSTLSTSGEKK